MKSVRATALVAGLAATAMALSACGGSGASTGPGASSGSATAGGISVGLAYDIGGRGDKSFNDSAAKGLDQAKTELGATVQESEAQPNETDAEKGTGCAPSPSRAPRR